KAMLERGKTGGWVTYDWNNGLKTSYVRTVFKNGKPFIIGTGFFPEAPQAIAQLLVSLVEGSINSIGLDKTASIVNDPTGPFVRGYIAASIIDFDGNVLTSAEYPITAGQNFINYKDANGKYIFKDMISIGKSPEGTGWIDFVDKGEPKRSYVKAITDKITGKKYIITAGYYPTIDSNAVKSFVRKGINYLRANGKDAAFHEFSNTVGDFVRGGMRIYMYDLDGNVIADGYNPFLIGQNIINVKDPEGHPRVKRIIDQVNRSNRGWTSYRDRNGYFFTYFEKVEVPDGRFIIGSGFYPWRKAQEVRSMVEEGMAYLKGRELLESLDRFASPGNDFLRGDIHLILYDQEGYCLAYSLARNRVWDDIKNLRDDRGRSIFEQIRSTAARGGGWVEYKFNNALRREYVRQIEKKVGDTTQILILSSAYYVL
ncbi:MAG TPA: cache domain-containing protein, partial [Candidatus Babeliaceae bacterium]|nr:cache domain-containing protein [Candidatus Babeliaceae bacterium]